MIEFIRRHRQFLLYALIGVCGLSIDTGLYLVMYNRFDVTPGVANAISTSCGITTNFMLNLTLNFRVQGELLARFLSFYTVGIIGLALATVILLALIRLGVDANIAKVATLGPVLVTQYFLNSRITFRGQLGEEAAQP